jgi:REP element-mobilizing transposase RayT
MEKQRDILKDIGHGGRRKGAGRPCKKDSLHRHKSREDFNPKHPLHINIKLEKGLPTLRAKASFKLVKQAILKARQKGLRIIHFSVQSNHLHLLIESDGKEKLAQSMQSLCTSLAKSINSRLQRKGKVFKDRYHVHILKTLREVKHAMVYIFQNFAKHTKIPNRFDPYSTLICFKEKVLLGLSKVNTHKLFKNESERELLKNQMQKLIDDPVTWHLNVGWKKA